MTKFGFDPDRLYRPRDTALAVIAAPGLLAQWRHYGRGPAFIRRGRKVFYSGADLIDWLEQGRVETTNDNERTHRHGNPRRGADGAAPSESRGGWSVVR